MTFVAPQTLQVLNNDLCINEMSPTVSWLIRKKYLTLKRLVYSNVRALQLNGKYLLCEKTNMKHNILLKL